MSHTIISVETLTMLQKQVEPYSGHVGSIKLIIKSKPAISARERALTADCVFSVINVRKYQLPTPYSFRVIAWTKFIGQGPTARSKVKSGSQHDVAHLQPSTNVPTTYQHPTPYSCRDIARTRFYRSRSLRQGQIKVTP